MRFFLFLMFLLAWFSLLPQITLNMFLSIQFILEKLVPHFFFFFFFFFFYDLMTIKEHTQDPLELSLRVNSFIISSLKKPLDMLKT
jgi:hypothetical protein